MFIRKQKESRKAETGEGVREIFETGRRQTGSPECCGMADLSSVCLLSFTATAVGSALPRLTCASLQAHQTFIKPNSPHLIGPHPHLLSLTFANTWLRNADVTPRTQTLHPQTRQRQGHLNCRCEALQLNLFLFFILWFSVYRGVWGDGNDVPYQFTCSHLRHPRMPWGWRHESALRLLRLQQQDLFSIRLFCHLKKEKKSPGSSLITLLTESPA